MTSITTTSDYLTWNVNLDLHTQAEIDSYIADLDINTLGDVRSVIIQAVDRTIIINGIAFIAPLYQTGEGLFSTAMGAYSAINQNRVKAIHYYPDRSYVMVEYLAHPADVRPKNTEHNSAEFGSFFQNVFSVWQTALNGICAGTLLGINESSTPTATPTGY